LAKKLSLVLGLHFQSLLHVFGADPIHEAL
jgi:hypothetical protein